MLLRCCLTRPDCLRPPPDTTPVTSESARHADTEPGHLPRRPQTHQTTTLCMSGKSRHPDDRVEGCTVFRGLYPRHRSGNIALRLGLSSRSSRRSHSWTKNQPHCTSDRLTTRPLTGISLGSLELYQCHSLICMVLPGIRIEHQDERVD
jgi:hypothetical protein